jgi:tetratricopeptide (TPR) repeat protein
MVNIIQHKVFYMFLTLHFRGCFLGKIHKFLYIFAIVTGLITTAQAQEQTTISQLSQQINAFVQKGDPDAADALLNEAITNMPNRAEPLIMQARLALLQNNADKAFASLERAIELGFADLGKLLTDPAFVEMQIHQGIGRLLKQSAALVRTSSRPVPAIRKDGRVKIGAENLIWDASAKRYLALIDLNSDDNDDPMTSLEATEADISYLRTLEKQGISCGLKGILYDNRDRSHSLFNYKQFPQLTRTSYDEQLRKRSMDYGLGNKLTFPAITFGNSSTRYKITQGGSLPRRSMMWPSEAGRAFQNYISDHIYVYPGAHDDYPANWPYTFTSKGNSGSDRWLLRSIALILAALPCETRERLDQENLIAPTVQMIFRREQLHILSREAYLSGAAHPTIFDKSVIAPKRMMGLAASLRPADIPPLMRMKIIEEGFSESAGLAGLNEKLVTTPSAIARVWRGWSGRQVMKINASDTVDPNGRDLTFEWRLLRGDPKRIKIEADGPNAKITVDWHTEITQSPGKYPKNIRVEIGVFANNGVHDSAPAFITIHFPSHQKRRYTRGLKGAPRLMSIDYNALKLRRPFDPVLYWSAPWEDQFGYDTKGDLAGWVRRTKTARTLFSADGQLPDRRKPVYRVHRNSDKPPILVMN